MNHKVIIITGASKGLGKQIALNLSKKYQSKASFVLCARSLEQLNEVKEQVEKNKSSCQIVIADTTKEKDNKRIIEQTIIAYKKVTHIILNAGISMWSKFSEISKITDIKKIMDTNYTGPAYLLYHSLPYLKENKSHVIAISSLQGIISMPKHSAYAASKHALHGLIDSISLEEPQIQFSKALLGWVRGTEIRKNRLIETKDYQQKSNSNYSKKNHNKLFSISSEKCAKKILALIEKPQKQIFIPFILKFSIYFNFVFPNLLKKILLKTIKLEQK